MMMMMIIIISITFDGQLRWSHDAPRSSVCCGLVSPACGNQLDGWIAKVGGSAPNPSQSWQENYLQGLW